MTIAVLGEALIDLKATMALIGRTSAARLTTLP